MVTKGAVRLVFSLALYLFLTGAMAEELRSVDPKTVIDGDTFYVSVRLLGIDAPEEGKRAKCDQERELAKKAGDRAKQLLQGRVSMDVRGVDKFGRLLARVELSDGRDLGGVLIQEHLAKAYQEGQRRNWC
jgi:micrococcal nuclease